MTESYSPDLRTIGWSALQWVCIIGILLLAAVARFYLLGDQSLWYDESDRVFIASLPIRQVFPTVAEEGLHYLPLYFLLLKPFAEPFRETMARFPSAFFGILTVAIFVQVGRVMWGRRGGLIAALLLALNPFHVWLSRDASFYAPNAQAIADAWRAEGVTHVLLYRTGYRAITDAGFDPVIEADQATLARLLTEEMVQIADFGGAYELYAFSGERWP
jgi:hypothetical protein